MDSSSLETVIWPLALPLSVHNRMSVLYACGHGYEYYPASKEYALNSMGLISFRTYMNSFPYAKWVKETGIESIRFKLRYRGGAGELLLFAERSGQRELVKKTVFEAVETNTEVYIDVPPLGAGTILLSVEVMARDGSKISESLTVVDAGFVTLEPKVREVSATVVITTYNRPSDLSVALRAMQDMESLSPNTEILIVNNGKKITQPKSMKNIRILQNKNLGGAGGFTRGLCTLLEEKKSTHALFMDDDAMCHPISVLRSISFLEYAKRDDAAIGGAMLYSQYENLQYEQGGSLAPYGVSSINQNYDLADYHNVIQNELAPQMDFGPWWFFLFPLKKAQILPFPFFVRGDDIAFSVQNKFHIVSINSGAAWQPSFEYKISAGTEYLAVRSFLALPLVTGNNKWTCSGTMHGFRQQFFWELDGYRYAIAEAMLAALEDCLMGPSFWESESNTLARIGKLKMLEVTTTAKAGLGALSHVDHNMLGRRLGRVWYKIQRKVPVIGRLKFRRPGITYNMWPQPVEAAARKGMVYVARDGSNKIECRFNARWARALRQRFDSLTACYEKNFEENQKLYEESREKLQGKDAWTKKFAR